MMDDRERRLVRDWHIGAACLSGMGAVFVYALEFGGDSSAPLWSVFRAILAVVISFFPVFAVSCITLALLEETLRNYRLEQQPKEDQRILEAVDFFRRYGAILVDSPEKEGVFAEFVARGVARKDGNVYVNTDEAWREHITKSWDAYWAQGGQLLRPDQGGEPSQPPEINRDDETDRRLDG
jgi:hypothetical protein